MNPALRRAWRLPRLLAHLVFGVVAAYALLPSARHPGPRRPWQLALIGWWMRRLCRILRVRITVHGRPAEGGALLAGNHISWLDIPCLMAVAPSAFVAKQEVRDWPVIGQLAVRTGSLFMHRGDARVTSLVTGEMSAALRAARRVAVFPEGTSTDGRGVRMFHARLFEAAISTGAMVQPVAIDYPDHAGGVHPAAPFVGDDELTAHLWRLLGEPAITASLHFCEPLPAAGRERKTLAETARQRVISALETHGRGTTGMEPEAGARVIA